MSDYMRDRLLGTAVTRKVGMHLYLAVHNLPRLYLIANPDIQSPMRALIDTR
jgi:hypothetical protein